MADMKVFLELIAKSEKFQQGMQQGERALKGFQGFAQKTGQVVSDLTQKFGVLGQVATALTTGLVLKKLFSISDYMPIDDSLLRMRVNLKASGAEMDAFKKKIVLLSGETGFNLGEAFQGASKLSLSYTQNDILQIMKASEKVAKTIKAPYDIVQDSIVDIMKLCRLSGKDAEALGDALITSRVNMEALPMLMQRLALRGGAKKDYIEQLGMLRGMGMSGLSNPRSIMQVYTILEAIQNQSQLLENSGIKVRKINADGTTEWRSQLEVLKDLEPYIQKMQKHMSPKKFNEVLNQTFGPNAKFNLDFIFSQKENFKKGVEEMGHSAEIATARASAAAEAWENQLNRVKSQIDSIKTDLSFIYDLAKTPVKFMADHPNLTKAGGYTAGAASFAVLTALFLSNIKKVFGGLGKTGLGIAEGKAIETAMGITPVFVVNMPASGILGENVSDAAIKTGFMASLLGGLTPVLAGVSAFSFYKYPGLSGAGVNAADNAGGNGNFSKEQDDLIAEAMEWGKEHYPKELPMIYNDEYKRGGDKNNFVFNFKFDKNGRVTGDTNTADADFIINIARGDFGY